MAGDDRQLSSVRRGGMFTELANRFNAIELRACGDNKTIGSGKLPRILPAANREGLRAYAESGHIHWQEALDDSRAQ